MNNPKLAVEVVRAHNLMPKDGQGSSNPFVEIQFDGQKFRTTVKEHDLNPSWNETFYFNVSKPNELHDLTLEAHVYTTIQKTGNSKSSLGKVRLTGTSFVSHTDAVVFNYPLEKGSVFSRAKGELGLKVYVTNDPNINASVPIPDSSKNEKVEEPVISNAKKGFRATFFHLPNSSSNQPKEAPIPPSSDPVKYRVDQTRALPPFLGTYSNHADFTLKETSPILGKGQVYDLVEPMQFLFVRVVKANDLPSKNPTGLDPFVEVRLGNYKGVTKHFEKTQNPEWNTVFTFSKENTQAHVLEVVVKDKNMLKDEFLGTVKFELHDIPTRVPPNSPLAPEWYRIEDKKGRKKNGEIMLAVWIGTQADEAFPEAWHSDGSGSDSGSAHIRSKVYHSPRLWYVSVHVIEAQDLVLNEKNRMPNLHVKVQISGHMCRTRAVQSQPSKVVWDEEMMLVAAEPFDDHLVLSVEDREEVIGKVFIPLNTVDRRADNRYIHPRWFNLQSPNSNDEEELKSDRFSSQVNLRICLDGGYHVLDESTHYSSDFRPTAKQLWKPPIGILELGILNADALTPMKMGNGRGTSDTFCVAKYGQKWVRTRTIKDSLNPKYNEQYSWEVFDPATVLTVGVFDNGQTGNDGNNKDVKIGKVRIRISTLETGRVYTHSYPLLLLHPSGVKKMGELHLAIRFSCNSMVDMMSLYSRPLLPKMHYVKPLSVAHLDTLRHQAVAIVAARFSRAEPPLRKEVIEYMTDADSHLWSMRRSKANFFRLMAVFNGVIFIGKWFDQVRSWRNPITTVLVQILFVLLICFPELIFPTGFLYMFLIGLWNYRFRPRYPPHMDTRLSCADVVHPDELEEEFDTFPTSCNSDIVRMRYDRLRSVAGRIQTVVGDVAAQGERVQAMLSWRDPRATVIFMGICVMAAAAMYMVPFRLVVIGCGLYAMRHPRFWGKLPPAAINFFRRLPARTDSML